MLLVNQQNWRLFRMWLRALFFRRARLKDLWISLLALLGFYVLLCFHQIQLKDAFSKKTLAINKQTELFSNEFVATTPTWNQESLVQRKLLNLWRRVQAEWSLVQLEHKQACVWSFVHSEQSKIYSDLLSSYGVHVWLNEPRSDCQLSLSLDQMDSSIFSNPAHPISSTNRLEQFAQLFDSRSAFCTTFSAAFRTYPELNELPQFTSSCFLLPTQMNQFKEAAIVLGQQVQWLLRRPNEQLETQTLEDEILPLMQNQLKSFDHDNQNIQSLSSYSNIEEQEEPISRFQVLKAQLKLEERNDFTSKQKHRLRSRSIRSGVAVQLIDHHNGTILRRLQGLEALDVLRKMDLSQFERKKMNESIVYIQKQDDSKINEEMNASYIQNSKNKSKKPITLNLPQVLRVFSEEGRRLLKQLESMSVQSVNDEVVQNDEHSSLPSHPVETNSEPISFAVRKQVLANRLINNQLHINGYLVQLHVPLLVTQLNPLQAYRFAEGLVLFSRPLTEKQTTHNGPKKLKNQRSRSSTDHVSSSTTGKKFHSTSSAAKFWTQEELFHYVRQVHGRQKAKQMRIQLDQTLTRFLLIGEFLSLVSNSQTGQNSSLPLRMASEYNDKKDENPSNIRPYQLLDVELICTEQLQFFVVDVHLESRCFDKLKHLIDNFAPVYQQNWQIYQQRVLTSVWKLLYGLKENSNDVRLARKRRRVSSSFDRQNDQSFLDKHLKKSIKKKRKSLNRIFSLKSNYKQNNCDGDCMQTHQRPPLPRQRRLIEFASRFRVLRKRDLQAQITEHWAKEDTQWAAFIDQALEQQEFGLVGLTCQIAHRACLREEDLHWVSRGLQEQLKSDGSWLQLYPSATMREHEQMLHQLSRRWLEQLGHSTLQPYRTGELHQFQAHLQMLLVQFVERKRKKVNSKASGTLKTLDIENADSHQNELSDTSLESWWTESWKNVELQGHIDLNEEKQPKQDEPTLKSENCTEQPTSIGRLTKLQLVHGNGQIFAMLLDAEDQQIKVPFDQLSITLEASAAHCRCRIRFEQLEALQLRVRINLGIGQNFLTIQMLCKSKEQTSSQQFTFRFVLERANANSQTTFRPDMPVEVCEQQQECDFRVYPNEDCGLKLIDRLDKRQFSQYIEMLESSQLHLCNGQAEQAGRWLLPCNQCSQRSTCDLQSRRWLPRNCRHRNFGRQDLEHCLVNTKVLFLGDSTNRGMMHLLLKQLNGSLFSAEKTHSSIIYAKIGLNQSTDVAFAYYPQFWLRNKSPTLPNVLEGMLQLLQSIETESSGDKRTVLVVGGVQWFSTRHLNQLKQTLEKHGLEQTLLIVKTLGAGFHQKIQGVHHLPLTEQRKLAQHNQRLVDECDLQNVRLVDTFNMTNFAYQEFYPGKCSCHFHQLVQKSDGSYDVKGQINREYTNALLNVICNQRNR